MTCLPVAIARSFVNVPARLAVLALTLSMAAGSAKAAQFVINGPPGSGRFGEEVVTLPNGNIVVTDSSFDAPGPVANVGAVHLYRPNGERISTLRGTSTGDFVGNGGVVVLANGNFLVVSPDWNNGAADVGAVTFGNANIGFAPSVGADVVVSPSNSLVGTNADDSVGEDGILTLTNGNYVVISTSWNGNVGAATWGSGITGVQGAVSASNSLVGSTPFDQVGGFGSRALTNGNYVVVSTGWQNGAAPDAGAVTFGSGTSGVTGVVSPANSLVGSRATDQVGSSGVTPLDNGNYVVRSPQWNSAVANDVGAVTFGNGTSGIVGEVSASNSLVGSTLDDSVGDTGVVVLANNNYVVISRDWNNVAAARAGAVTFASGTTGISGPVTPTNSLVGTQPLDLVGNGGVTPLRFGRYVVCSSAWRNGAHMNAGAATFSGSTVGGITGTITAMNSLVGSAAGNHVCGGGVTVLTNGNYVVASREWDDGATANVGAATFASGNTGRSGAVSQANSLVGGTANDAVSSAGVVALINGNYVVLSPSWDRGTSADSGAATFGSGTTGINGVVSQTNSLVGSAGGDLVGSGGAIPLLTGNYVVLSPSWRFSAFGTASAGAVTFGSGATGISGFVNLSNSLYGTRVNDQVGIGGVAALTNGDYAVISPNWDNSAAIDAAGAVTFGSGTTGISGAVSVTNSLVGSAANDRVGSAGVTPLPNGDYVVNSANWSNVSATAAGAITLGLRNGSVVGAISNVHSVLGTVTNGGANQRFSHDPIRNQLAVGQPNSNRVVLQRPGIATSTGITSVFPSPSQIGQPVTITATVSALPNAPADGELHILSSNGQSCFTVTPTPASTTTNVYSCIIPFANAGTWRLTAEFRGSLAHAYSGSNVVTHVTLGNTIFSNGFEAP